MLGILVRQEGVRELLVVDYLKISGIGENLKKNAISLVQEL